MKPTWRKVYGQRDPSKTKIEILVIDRPDELGVKFIERLYKDMFGKRK